MTVTTTTSRDVKQGNGSTTDFPTSFEFFQETDLTVTLVIADGTKVVQTLNSDYTILGGGGDTGTVQMSTAPAADEQLVIERFTSQQQVLDLVANDILPAEALERVADQLVMIAQEISGRVDRAGLVAKDFTGNQIVLSKPNEGSLLIWDSNGNLVNTEIGEIDTNNVTVTTFGENLVQSANADSARGKLNVDDHTAAGDVDASFLEGNSASFYTNIPARLGYTPADVAGDNFQGLTQMVFDPSPGWFSFTPSSAQTGSNQGMFVEQQAGLVTFDLTAGGDPTGPLVIRSDNQPQWDNKTKLQNLLVEDDQTFLLEERVEITSGTSSFDIELPSNAFRVRVYILGWGSDDGQHKPSIQFFDENSNLINGANDYRVDTYFQASGNRGSSGQTRSQIEMLDFNLGSGVNSSQWPLDGYIDLAHTDNDFNYARVFGEITSSLADGDPSPLYGRFIGFLNNDNFSKQTKIPKIRILADNGDHGGTNVKWGTPNGAGFYVVTRVRGF